MTVTSINEDHGHAPTVDHGKVGIESQQVRSLINQTLAAALSGGCVTPYVGLERTRKVLTRWSIFLPGVNFLEGERGEHTFEVMQFGSKIGAHETGKIVTKDEIEYEVHFTWDACDGSCFCHAKIREVGETMKRP